MKDRKLMIILMAITVFSLLLHVMPSERSLPEKNDGLWKVIEALPEEHTFVGRCVDYRYQYRPRTLSTLDDVEIVRCEGAVLKEGDFATFAKFPKLVVLDIRESKFAQTDLSELRNCPSLRVLVLDGCRLTGEGIKALIGTAVVGVSIFDSQIDDSEVLQFREVSSLRWLVVGDRRFGENILNKFYGVIRLSVTMDCCYDLPKRYL